MTAIHATPSKRPMPLAARPGSGLNTPQSSPSRALEPDASPATKKVKGDGKACITAKRRALKRL